MPGSIGLPLHSLNCMPSVDGLIFFIVPSGLYSIGSATTERLLCEKNTHLSRKFTMAGWVVLLLPAISDIMPFTSYGPVTLSAMA